MTEDEVVGELVDGMTVGIGGWGSRRKPMSLVRAIVRSPVRDLTVVAYGGPDVGLLCAAGKVKKVVFAFVALDGPAAPSLSPSAIPASALLEPHFRSARQSGAIEVSELDEGMFLLGLQAAAWRVPFLPTRVGLGSDVPRINPDLQTVRSPYEDGEELLAVPALTLDVALVHMNRADVGGNGQYLGIDPYFDDLFCMAAERRFLSCERIVPTEDFAKGGPPQSLRINRLMTDGVVESRGGAHFTSCLPDYDRDDAFQQEYTASAKGPDEWRAFKGKYLDVGHDDYRKVVGL